MNKKKSASAFTIARACLVQSKLLNMRRILHRFRPKSESDAGSFDKKAKGNHFEFDVDLAFFLFLGFISFI